MPGWAEEACAEYARRMPRGYEVARIALRKSDHLRLPKGVRVIALDEHGKDLTSAQFAPLLEAESAFIIGGPDGLDERIKGAASLLLRVSSFTLPHALAQLVLLEQIYRAATVLTGHPYHRK